MKNLFLFEVPIGESIIVGAHNNYYEVCHYNQATECFEAIPLYVHQPKSINLIAVGFEIKKGRIGWDIDGRNAYIPKETNIYGCKYGWNIRSDLLVKTNAPTIINPNQICSICKLPAPHSKPNNGSQFVCASCKLLGEL